jgi:sialate O-acetylesterase
MNCTTSKATLAGAVLLVSCLANVANAGIIGASEAGYNQVYGLNIGAENLHTNIPYYLDTSSLVANGSFDRIAYHMELQKVGGPLEWVWVSMDAFTNEALKIGVPSFAGSNTSFQQLLINMNIFSNKSDIITGVGMYTGNIEFWPYDYGTVNTAGVPSASGSYYDSGDSNALTSNYGSMQIHNNGANQTLFALNRFATPNKDIGIGNQVGGSGHSDWTFAENSGQYSIKTLDVWVRSLQDVSEPPAAILLLLCFMGLATRRLKQIQPLAP